MADTGLSGLTDLLKLQQLNQPQRPEEVQSAQEVQGVGLMNAAQGIQADSIGAGLAKGFMTGYGIQQQKKGASKREERMNEYLAAKQKWAENYSSTIQSLQDEILTAKKAEMEAAQNGKAMYNALLGLEMGDASEFQNFVASNPNSAKMLYRDMPQEAANPTASLVNIDGAQYLQPAARLPNGGVWTGQAVPVDSLANRYYPDIYQERQAALGKQRQAQLDEMKTQAEIRKLNAQANKADGYTMQTIIDADGNEVQVPVQTPPSKPLPASALKLQNETMEELAIANNIQADLKAVDNLVASDKLNLGLFANWLSRGKNFAGLSDENSRNFQTFQSTLEKLRNDSLRLNKGVQTEGDSQRAWNELLANINDEGVVRQRLDEIQRINERASALKQMQIDEIRRNYGASPMDYSQLQKEPAIGQSQQQTAPTKFVGNQSAEQIRAAYQAGQMTREQARAALQQLGGQ